MLLELFVLYLDLGSSVTVLDVVVLHSDTTKTNLHVMLLFLLIFASCAAEVGNLTSGLNTRPIDQIINCPSKEMYLLV